MVRLDSLKRDKLLEYLNNYFIPKNLSKKNKIENYKVFSLVDSFYKYTEIMDYLAEKNIIITNRKRDSKELEYNGIRQISNQQQRKLLLQYFQLKDKESLNKLFESNLPLAAYIAYKYSNKSDIEKEEVYISAQEGLFHAITHYDPKENSLFSHYATKCMLGFIKRNNKLCGTSSNISTEIKKVESLAEECFQERLSENSDNYDKIVEGMISSLVESGICLDYYRKNDIDKYSIKDAININNPLNIDKLSNDYILSVSDDIVFEEVYNCAVKEVLNDIFEELSEKYKGARKQMEILRYKIGFDDNIFKTYEETAKKFNMKRQGAFIQESKALLKVRNSKYIGELRDFRK